MHTLGVFIHVRLKVIRRANFTLQAMRGLILPSMFSDHETGILKAFIRRLSLFVHPVAI
jgi:hypothetical protein